MYKIVTTVGVVTEKRIRITSAILVGATSDYLLLQDNDSSHETKRTVVSGIDTVIWNGPIIFNGLKVIAMPTNGRLELEYDDSGML